MFVRSLLQMSSLVGVFGQSSAPTYAATKGAITSFSKVLFLTWVGFNHAIIFTRRVEDSSSKRLA